MEPSGASTQSQEGRPKRAITAPKPYMTPELLIKEVRDRPALWDESLDDYKDRALKRKLWSDIAGCFVGGSPLDVQKSWNTLRRCLANKRNNFASKHGLSGSAGVQYKPYLYEHLMKFLDGMKGVDVMEGNLQDSRADNIADEMCGDRPALSEPEIQDDDESDTGNKGSIGSEDGLSAMNYSMLLEEAHFLQKEASSKATPKVPERPPLKPLVNMQPFKLGVKKHNLEKQPQQQPLGDTGNKENVEPSSFESQLPDEHEPKVKKVKLETLVETPASKRARFKKEKQLQKDRQREDVVKKLEREVALAVKAKETEKVLSKTSPKTNSQSCTCSTAVEEAILAELQKSSDDRVSLFLLSLTDELRLFPPKRFRDFQFGVLKLMEQLEVPEAVVHQSERCKVTVRGNKKAPVCASPTIDLTHLRQWLSEDQSAEAGIIVTAADDDDVSVIDGLLLKGADVHTLMDGVWLNDMVINAYLKLIEKRSVNELIMVFAFDSFLMEGLLNKDYETLATWFKKFNPDVHQCVFVPVHEKGHWSLVFVEIPERKMTYYCSMGSYSTVHLSLLELYFWKRWNLAGWSYEKATDMPLQINNSDDCGVFACMYANFISLCMPCNFTQADIPFIRRRIAYELHHTKLLDL